MLATLGYVVVQFMLVSCVDFFSDGKKMQIQLSNILTELGLLASVGVGYLLIKNRPLKINQNYNEYRMISNTTFPLCLDKFRQLEQDTAFEGLCNALERFLSLADTTKDENAILGKQFLMNRLCHDIDYRSRQMIYNARSSSKSDVIVACIDCEQDELQQLNENCQNILRNVLLMN